jgi:dTDP-glucose pyrophosphorylase
MTNLVMPMAGNGSRFPNNEFEVPKPYIQLQGKPFFYWAAQSVLKNLTSVEEIVFVIQEFHSNEFQADKQILRYFPGARIIKIDWPTTGSLETAVIGLEKVNQSNPVLINDCDHAFSFRKLEEAVSLLKSGMLDAFLAHFDSNSTSYSYAAYDANGFLRETAEKNPISNLAIAGIYAFQNANKIYENLFEYKETNSNSELFVSGIYNTIVKRGGKVKGFLLDDHVSFGTPKEFELVRQTPLPC